MSTISSQKSSDTAAATATSAREIARELTRMLTNGGGKVRMFMVARDVEGPAKPARRPKADDAAAVHLDAAPKKVRAARTPSAAADEAPAKSRPKKAAAAPAPAPTPAVAAPAKTSKRGPAVAKTGVDILTSAIRDLIRASEKTDDAGQPTNAAKSAKAALCQLTRMFENDGALPPNEKVEHRLNFSRKTGDVTARFYDADARALTPECIAALNHMSATNMS